MISLPNCLLALASLTAQSTAALSQLQPQNLPFVSQLDILTYSSFPVMATLLENANGWSPGEQAVHSLLHVPTSKRQNPTAAGLPPAYGHRVSVSPLVAIGTLDDQGRPWTSIWGGERGFARPIAQGVLGLQSLVDKAYDPVVQALYGGVAEGELVRPEVDKLMSALSIDLETRDRVKLAGRMMVGAVAGRPESQVVGEAQLAMLVQESLGNCPKYLNKKTIRAHLPSPRLVSSDLPLPPEALSLIEQADMFFLSSTNGQTMDTNHRGGPAGFIRVLSNSPSENGGDGVVLVYPEYSGNRLYQSLGNLHTNPSIGIAIPDYTTSDVLYLTGTTQLLAGASAASVMPHANLAVKITVHSARLVQNSLPFRGDPGEPSPYNPPVRRLATEQPDSASLSLSTPLATATLLRREALTPTIARLTFALHPGSSAAQALQPWHAGQHLTLSFAAELDVGYSHMRDDDPKSLNDDFVRSFTISNPPSPPPPPSSPPLLSAGQRGGGIEGMQVQLTVRRHGPVTGLLLAHPLGAGAGLLEVPVLAVGGEEGFRMLTAAATSASSDGGSEEKKKEEKKAVFVAGGIGITPLLAQAPGVLASGREVEVLWSVRGEDLGLVEDSLERIKGLGAVVRVFVTGKPGNEVEGMVERVRELGARVEVRRMERGDLLGARDAVRGTKYFGCASPAMLRSVVDWLGEEEVVFESFEY